MQSKKNTAILFKCHKLNKHIIKEFNKIKESCSSNYDVFLLYNNSQKDFFRKNFLFYLKNKDRCFLFDNKKIKKLQYSLPENLDFYWIAEVPILMFYLRNEMYDYYWAIDYDVRFNGSWQIFFDYYQNDDSDLLASYIRKYKENKKDFFSNRNWSHWNDLSYKEKNNVKLGAFFALVRYSNRALSLIDEKYRRGYAGFHEIAVPTLLNKEKYKIRDLSVFCKKRNFRYRPNFEKMGTEKNMLYHPVKDNLGNVHSVNSYLPKNILKMIKKIRNWRYMAKRKKVLFFLKCWDLILTMRSSFDKKNKNPNPQFGGVKKINPVYFTCSDHFPYLLLSLRSIEKLKFKRLGNIYVYFNKKNPLTKKQIKQLDKIKMNFIIRPTKFAYEGPFEIINELEAFRDISLKIGPNDYINKIDSDVLFISDGVYKKVINSEDSLIGQKEKAWLPFFFTQGGSYFLRNSIISSITNKKIFNIIDEVCKHFGAKSIYIDVSSEDAVIYTLVKKQTNKIKFYDYYFPEDKLNDLKSMKTIKKKHSVIHFRKNKQDMIKIAKKLKII